MTKFVVHTDVEEEQEEVRFALKSVNGGVMLHTVNKDGVHITGTNILTISKRGTLLRHGGINNLPGVNLDSRKSIKDGTR